MNALHTLIRHDHWAMHRLVDALREHRAFTAEACVLVDHIFSAHMNWQARIRQEPPTAPIWDGGFDPSGYPSRIEEISAEWLGITESFSEDEVIAYQNSAGHSFRNTVGEIVLHAMMHAQYHRGQVITRTRHLLPAAPALDLVVFFRESGHAL